VQALKERTYCIEERKGLLPRVREGSGIHEVVMVTTADRQ
jgi:hypothetical protein